jgi:hypothetical protein
MYDTLRQCEREVEQARFKLSHDLATLRAPETFSSFTDDLKRDALETKDALIDQAKQTAQSKLSDFVEDLKARAAANPAAALAIGAGIAWRLLSHPPIATVLIGAGIYSLWRTDGFQPHNRSGSDYFQHGKERLKEQASQLASGLASSAKEVAADVGGAVSDKTAEMIEAAKTRAQEWSDDVSGAAAAVGSALKAEAQSLNARASDAVQSTSDRVRAATTDASTGTAKFVREAMHETRDALTEVESRDKLLLGVAGIAVAAALGIACQKRIAEEVE